MTVKDEKGKILRSQNPVITKMWEKAGYEEVSDNKTASAGKRRRKE